MRSNTNNQRGLSFLVRKSVGKRALFRLMIDTLMDKPNVCCTVSGIFGSEVVAVFFNHHKWIFFLHKSAELISGPVDSLVLAAFCSEGVPQIHGALPWHAGLTYRSKNPAESQDVLTQWDTKLHI